MKPKKFYLAFLPVTLLVIVALNQIHLAHTVHLSPWKGGGFGMFSSTDGGPNRHLRIFLRGLPSRHEVQVPQPLEDLADRAEALEPLLAEEREITRSSGICASRFSSSSEMPSEKYS